MAVACTPVGRCVTRTADSVRLTCWPPGPLARIVSHRTSFTSKPVSSTGSKISIPTNQFFRLWAGRNGLRAVHCTVPRQEFANPSNSAERCGAFHRRTCRYSLRSQSKAIYIPHWWVTISAAESDCGERSSVPGNSNARCGRIVFSSCCTAAPSIQLLADAIRRTSAASFNQYLSFKNEASAPV